MGGRGQAITVAENAQRARAAENRAMEFIGGGKKQGGVQQGVAPQKGGGGQGNLAQAAKVPSALPDLPSPSPWLVHRQELGLENSSALALLTNARHHKGKAGNMRKKFKKLRKITVQMSQKS